jgi:transcription elongation factor GreA
LTGSAEETSLAEAARRYVSTLSAGDPAPADVLQFVRWFEPDRRLRAVRGHDVATWAESLSTSSPISERRVESVRGFLAYLKKQGLTESNLGSHARFRRSSASRRNGGTAASKHVDAERKQLTADGHAALLTELDELKGQRPRIAEELSRAMADKDFRENAPLDAARDKQAHLEARIREIEETLKVSDIVSAAAGATARLGSTVTLVNVASGTAYTYTLVSPNEVSPSQGKISAASPVGRAVLDRSVGEEVEVTAPSGVVRYRIDAVRT